jgi:hypothetical protein
VTDQPQPPRLQDTTERSALPLPLPDHGTPGEGPVYAARGEQPTFAAPADEPTFAGPADEPAFAAPVDPAPIAFAAASAEDDEPEASTEESDAVPDVDPEEPAPIPDEPRPADRVEPAGDDGQPDLDPVFAPPAAEAFAAGGAEDSGPAPEVMVGAAFLGGVALAFLIKRLGS